MIEGQKESLSQIPQLKYAMIGGGTGSFIGDVHRKAIAMDGKARLVAGCFSRNYEDTLKTGETLRLDKSRLYRNYDELLKDRSLILSSLSLPMIRIIRSPARLSNLDFR